MSKFKILPKLARFCIAGTVVLAMSMPAQASDPDISGDFTDENFRAVVYERIGKEAGGPIYVSDVNSITALTANDRQITSLSGIEHFTALTELEVISNQLTALDVSSNIALTDLDVRNNQLTALDVSSNTALTFLDAGYNQLTTLDVSSNTALTFLDAGRNQLTTLDVSSNIALTTLNAYGNQLTTLDVSSNTELTRLNVRDNQLTALDVSSNTALTDLWVFNNQLTTFDVSSNTALTVLNVRDNQLTALDVSSNTALTVLFVFNNFMPDESAVVGFTGEWGTGVNDLFRFHPQNDPTSVSPTARSVNRNQSTPTITIRGKTLDVRTSSSATGLQIRLIDVKGRTVTRFNMTGGGSFSLNRVPSGRYFVDMRDMDTGRRSTSSVVLR